MLEKNWPTVCASEVRQGFQDRSRGMKGSQESLTTAVVKDAANWLTPQSGDVTGSTREAVVMWANGQRPKTSDQRLRTQVAAEQLKHGQAAPASSSSLGSRQGLWQTPKATNADCPVIHNPQRSDGGQPNLAAQMVLEQQRQWMTPRACEAQNPPMGVDKRHHGLTHQVTRQWATPNACDHKGATTPEACKQWESRGQNLPEMVNGMWPTPASCTGNGDSHGLDGGSGARSMLPEDMKRSSGKLNPRWVETLMGLPIGWTMPSCTSPQTIAPMSCDFSAMEFACQPLSVLGEFSLASWPSPRLNENQQTEELGLLWAENGFKQPKTRGGKARANGSTFDVTLETAARGVAAMETST
jgi:hypothetical protein